MSYYENIYYCQKCSFMQIETPQTQPIRIPCPKCGWKVLTSTEPNFLEREQEFNENMASKEYYDNNLGE